MKWVAFPHTPLDHLHYCGAYRHRGPVIPPAEWVSLIWDDLPDGSPEGSMTVREMWFQCTECMNMMKRDVENERESGLEDGSGGMVEQATPLAEWEN